MNALPGSDEIDNDPINIWDKIDCALSNDPADKAKCGSSWGGLHDGTNDNFLKAYCIGEWSHDDYNTNMNVAVGKRVYSTIVDVSNASIGALVQDGRKPDPNYQFTSIEDVNPWFVIDLVLPYPVHTLRIYCGDARESLGSFIIRQGDALDKMIPGMSPELNKPTHYGDYIESVEVDGRWIYEIQNFNSRHQYIGFYKTGNGHLNINALHLVRRVDGVGTPKCTCFGIERSGIDGSAIPGCTDTLCREFGAMTKRMYDESRVCEFGDQYHCDQYLNMVGVDNTIMKNINLTQNCGSKFKDNPLENDTTASTDAVNEAERAAISKKYIIIIIVIITITVIAILSTALITKRSGPQLSAQEQERLRVLLETEPPQSPLGAD